MFDNLSYRQKVAIAVLLLIPLIIAVGWLIFIKTTSEAPGIGQGTLLSPLETTPLVVSLIIFTAGYLFFIGIMFSTNIREAIEDIARRARR